MKYWVIKLSLLVVIFFSFILFEGVVINKVFRPYFNHYSFLAKSEQKYIQKEKGLNSIFIEVSNNRIHSILHESEDDVFDCEEDGDISCYISAIACWINDDDVFWSKFLVKGNLPVDSNEIVISEELSKRRHINLGDIISIKSPIFYKTAKVSGILMNPYGIPVYEKDNSFYILSRITDDYTTRVRGTWFSFTNSIVNDFGLENIKDSLSFFKRTKLLILTVTLILRILLNIIVLFGIQRVLTLRQFYNSLLTAGICKREIKKRIIIFNIIFIVLSLSLSFLITKLKLFIMLDCFATLFVAVSNFLFLRRKTYGFN